MHLEFGFRVMRRLLVLIGQVEFDFAASERQSSFNHLEKQCGNIPQNWEGRGYKVQILTASVCQLSAGYVLFCEPKSVSLVLVLHSRVYG